MPEILYQSTLSKQGLAYNIIYHLSNMEDGQSAYEIIENILTNFEIPVKNS